jgi:hypothetical protein
MRINFKQLLVFGLLSFNQQVKSQDCVVLADSLKGKYTGECKNGKADGQGKAEGVDTYEGTFRSGLPHGQGKYMWKNGNTYTGSWTKGNKDGDGVITYKIDHDKDSIVKGFWKKDKFIGFYERPYKFIANTVHITSKSAKKINDKYNQVDIFLDSETGKMIPGSESRAPQINDITLINGAHMRIIQNSNLGKKISYSLEDVTFPFRAIFTIGNDSFEIEIFEPGKWVLDIRTSF